MSSYGISSQPKSDRKRTLSSSSSSSDDNSASKAVKTDGPPARSSGFRQPNNNHRQDPPIHYDGYQGQPRKEVAHGSHDPNQGNFRDFKITRGESSYDSGFSKGFSPSDPYYGSGAGSSQPQGEGLAPVVARHYNEIEEKGLEAREESKIVILRKYNNWAKSMNFNDAMDQFRKEHKRFNSLIGLDLCCGKGGDLRKWEKSRMMKHVVFVDIAEVSVTNCKTRYEDMKQKHDEIRERRGGRGVPLFTAEFIVADCTQESVKSKLSDPDMQFDLVSCQFSFHYCFESYPQAQQMLRNATENLVSGGYFIGTLPNADRIVKRRRECGGDEFGNEVYKVKFECDEPYPVFGARYFFELEEAVSCPEFLVNFPALITLADSFGLSLVYRHALDTFHDIHVARPDAKGLLNGMGALESYPPAPGDQLHFKEENYEHAARYIKGLMNAEPHRDWTGVKVGTVSAVEWEAITLYLAFCFRKKEPL